MLQFLRVHLIRFVIYYSIFYTMSIMLPFCPCNNKLNTWFNGQRNALILVMQECKKENSVAGKISKFVLDVFAIK